MRRRSVSLFLCVCMVLTLLPVSALAAEAKVVTLEAPHSVEELNAKWATLKPVNTGDPYTQEPQTSQMEGQPTLGKVQGQVLTDGLNSLNFVRYMAGLGSDVSVISDFQESAQYAAVLLAYRDTTLTHTPDQPYGLDDAFYKKGYEGTYNSILYRQNGRNSAVTGLADSVHGFLVDGGENNKDKGHRDSVLDPLMTGTGLGMATSPSGMTYCAIWNGYGGHLNGTGTKTTDYEAITWPVAGYQATDFFGGSESWSIRLNSKRYDMKKLDDVKVTVTGPDGSANVIPHHIGQYHDMIIFDATTGVSAGQKYEVEVTGLYRKDEPATLKYTVKFFQLGKTGDSAGERLAADKIAVENEVKDFSYLVNNYTRPEDMLNCLLAATRYVDSLRWTSGPTVTQATDKKAGTYQGTLTGALDGQSFVCEVKMTIPKNTRNDNVYRATAVAQAMKVSGATTAEDVVQAVSPVLDSGCSASVSNFHVTKVPTATEPGKLSYYLYTKNSEGKQLARASIVRVIPAQGREDLQIPMSAPTFTSTPEPTPTPTAAPAPSTPSANMAYPSTQSVEVDRMPVEFEMYALKDANGNPTNYIKVRDLALMLIGSNAQFGVEWDGAVDLVPGAFYIPNGSELSTPFTGERAYSVPTVPTKINGVASDLQAIYLTDDNGGGYTYYQLRDLGRKLGFNVSWSAEKGVFIETDKPYSEA